MGWAQGIAGLWELHPQPNTEKIIPGKYLEGQKILIREDDTQKEVVSFCDLIWEMIPNVWPLASYTFSGESGEPWLASCF